MITLNNKPSFIGIGAQKCASTWIYQVLLDHPNVRLSSQKEIDFFSYKYDHGLQWYQNFFLDLNRGLIGGEISPSYFHYYDAPKRAAAYNPSFKIIVTLRDPVDRAFSNHLHEIRVGHYVGPDLSFEAGIKNNPMYLEQSRYFTHIKKWLEFFPKEHFLFLLQEEIKKDPEKQARVLYEFLGIDSEHQSLFLQRQANVSYSEKMKGVDGLLRKMGWLGRRLGGRNMIEALKKNSRVVRLREANRRHLSQVVPAMAPATEERLRKMFSEEVREIAKLLGRDNLPWKTCVNEQVIRISAEMNESP